MKFRVLHHGPEVIDLLAANPPEQDVYDEAIEKIWRLQELELYQRNEQFLHPLTDVEVGELARRMQRQEIEPVNLYREALQT